MKVLTFCEVCPARSIHFIHEQSNDTEAFKNIVSELEDYTDIDNNLSDRRITTTMGTKFARVFNNTETDEDHDDGQVNFKDFFSGKTFQRRDYYYDHGDEVCANFQQHIDRPGR